MAAPKKAVGIDARLAGRSFTLTCAIGEEAELRQAIEFLDAKIDEIQVNAKTSTPERLLVLAALNLAHEVMQARGLIGRLEGLAAQEQALLDLAQRIDKARATL